MLLDTIESLPQPIDPHVFIDLVNALPGEMKQEADRIDAWLTRDLERSENHAPDTLDYIRHSITYVMRIAQEAERRRQFFHNQVQCCQLTIMTLRAEARELLRLGLMVSENAWNIQNAEMQFLSMTARRDAEATIYDTCVSVIGLIEPRLNALYGQSGTRPAYRC